MGRKQDINKGAIGACLVVAVIVGIGTQSLGGAVITFLVLGGILVALRIVR